MNLFIGKNLARVTLCNVFLSVSETKYLKVSFIQVMMASVNLFSIFGGHYLNE